jgi:hypothetical protein
MTATSDGAEDLTPCWDQWMYEGRLPYLYEIEQRPPYPWDPDVWLMREQRLLTTDGTTMQTSSMESGGGATMGFYRVFHVPNLPASLGTAIIQGLTFVPIDYADYVDRVVSTEVIVNGQASELTARNTRTFNNTVYEGVDFFTDLTTNGSWQAHLLTTIRLEDEVNEFTPTLTFTGKTVTVNISNAVYFTNWEATIVGSTTTFEAFSIVPNVNWTIEVYDVVDDFVISHSGSTTDGRISWTWDLRDFTGMLRNDWEYDPVFYPEITISIPGSGGGATAAAAQPTPRKALDYPTEGTWVIAYQDRVQNPAARPDYQASMEEIAGGPAFWDILRTIRLLRYGTNTTQTQRNDSWLSFRADLTTSSARNYYYQGHGAGTLIGGDIDSLDASGNPTGARITGTSSRAYLTTEWVRNNITFNRYTGARLMRFVFLDGCETAKGDWPQAFGVPKLTNTLAYYTAPNRRPNSRPSAFVGWEKIVGGSPQWGTTSGYRLFRGDWMFHWALNNEDLDEAFNNARLESGWITQQLMNEALRIYGYNQMGFLDYNNRSSWPGP